MPKTLFVSLPQGGTLSVRIESLNELSQHVCLLTGIPVGLQKYHHGGKLLNENIADLSTITLFLSLEGGKGGFGSLLRNQAQTRRKITNWDHSRDRQGRRIANVKNENRLVEYFKKKKEEEVMIQKEVEKVKIMQDTIKQNHIDHKLDQEYKHKVDHSDELIVQTMNKAKQKKEQKANCKKRQVSESLMKKLDEAIENVEEAE